MRFSGVLRWRDDEGNEGDITRFHDVVADNEELARRAVIDEWWDERLSTTCCIPIVTFTRIDDDEDEESPNWQ
ncbi:MAG: hypothetical protein GXX96_17310 [Planctomycetaceae bacterium]|nr:hypothetical protein [Planctomycetaceae bacterium]